MPDSADSSAILSSTSPRALRGTTPSWTMYTGAILPTAANADLRPTQIAARSAGSSASLISVAPACSHSARTAATPLRVALRAVQFHDEHRAGAFGVAAAHRGLGSLDRQRVHHLDRRGDDAGPDDRRHRVPPGAGGLERGQQAPDQLRDFVRRTTILVATPRVPSEPANAPRGRSRAPPGAVAEPVGSPSG